MTFSREHNVTLADLSPSAIIPIIERWTQVYATHLSPNSPLASLAPPTTLLPSSAGGDITNPSSQYRYMQIFENKGAAMGCSNPHPHCQVWTTSTMPEEPSMELDNLKKFRKERGGAHMLEEYAKLESEKKERVIFENDAFIAVCPWWGTWPFETMVVAKKHKRSLVDLSTTDTAMLAEVIAEITRRYDNLFQTHFPYSK
jgi:UDPglucose--hexose-1-phosphate uridylyltransferase